MPHIKSHELFDAAIKNAGQSNRTLAADTKTAVSTIAHLRRGARTYATPAVAEAIEQALDMPTGALFLPDVPSASGSARQETA